MALCEGSTLKPWLMALKFLPLLVLPKSSLHTKFQIKIPSHFPYRNSQSFLQKPKFDAHLSSWPPQSYPTSLGHYWTTKPRHRHAWATVAAPSARVHRVSTLTACQRRALSMAETSPSRARLARRARSRAPLSIAPMPHPTPPSLAQSRDARWRPRRRRHCSTVAHT